MSKQELIIKPKRTKGDDGYKVFSIRIKEEVSAKTNRSRNELIGTFLNYALDHCVIQDTSESLN